MDGWMDGELITRYWRKVFKHYKAFQCEELNLLLQLTTSDQTVTPLNGKG